MVTLGGRLSIPITTAVAAAASVPASSTETNALCTTSLMNNWQIPVMPEKSAISEVHGPSDEMKATGMPIVERV